MSVSCDVFCRVIDNFGDAAVAWRLARVLALEHGFRVRLFVDRLEILKPLLGLAPEPPMPRAVDEVEIVPFDQVPSHAAALLLETFGCGLPAAYPVLLPEGERVPVLINVEYLTAESWVDDVHGLSSPARGGLPARHFFFPGFSASTGGLLREADLRSRRNSAGSDAMWRARFFAALGVPFDLAVPVVSLFCYERAVPDDFLEVLAAHHGGPLHVLVAEGVIATAVEHFCGARQAGTSVQQGRLRVSVVAFLPQRRFDELLWACDGNVVRGEDSFVRAQLAGRPMLWDIYPQDDDAHFKKLDAFLVRYTACWPVEVRQRYCEQANALVRREPSLFQTCFAAWCDSLPVQSPWAESWSEELDKLPELAGELAIFAGKLVK